MTDFVQGGLLDAAALEGQPAARGEAAAGW
jgi:hypothetical protein